MRCIYKIVSIKFSGRIYIGGTSYFFSRKSHHISSLINKSHRNHLLQDHVNEHGIDDLRVEILEFVRDIESLSQREQYYLELYKPSFNIYTSAGSHAPKGTRSEEFKKAQSERMRGQKRASGKRSLEFCERMRIQKTGTKIHSEEFKQKHRQFMTGKKYGLGYKHTAEAREKIKAASTGKTHTPESIEKMREIKRQYWANRKAQNT